MAVTVGVTVGVSVAVEVGKAVSVGDGVGLGFNVKVDVGFAVTVFVAVGTLIVALEVGCICKGVHAPRNNTITTRNRICPPEGIIMEPF